MSCDLRMLSRVDAVHWLENNRGDNAHFSRLMTDRQIKLLWVYCFAGSNPKPVVLKHKTIFCLLAQSQQSMTMRMENISASQLVLLSGSSSHGWTRVGADVGMENESRDGLIWTLMASSVYFPQLIPKPRDSNSEDFARMLKHQIYVSTPASNRAQPLWHLCTSQPCRKRQMCFQRLFTVVNPF